MAFSFKLENEDFTKINEDAEQYRKEYKERGFRAGVPVCFLGDGNYVFRIYPDRDPKGFIRLIKRAWIHTGIPVEEKKLRFWQDDRVNKLLKEAKDAGLEKILGRPIYQSESREQGYMMAHFYESADEEHTKPNQSYATILNRRQMFAVFDFIAELHPEDKKAILDPNISAPGIKLQITKGGGKANVSCGIAGFQKVSLPDLEFKEEDGTLIEYTGLDSVWITEDDKISDEDFFKLRTLVYTEIANFRAAGGQAKDKSAEGHRFGDRAAESPREVRYSTGPSQPFKASEAGNLNPGPQGATNGANAPAASPEASQASPPSTSQAVTAVSEDEIRCRLAEQVKANPKMADVYQDPRFGNRPNRATPYCLVCSWESECAILTEKNRKVA